jgi:phage terminase small subunit
MAGSSFSGRPDIDNQLATKGKQEPPEMPEDLVGVHPRQLWKQALEDLPHCLRQCDFAILRLACESYQASMEAYAAGDDRTGLAAARGFMIAAKEIGLTPNARRIIKPVEGEVEESDFQKWLKRHGGLNG